MASFSMTLDDP